jgi:hypothetical protein
MVITKEVLSTKIPVVPNTPLGVFLFVGLSFVGVL